MLVSRDDFDQVLENLAKRHYFSLDVETTGLYPYKGDRLFSLQIGITGRRAFYFNFWPSYVGLEPKFVLSKEEHLAQIGKALFRDPQNTFFIHKFNFDMHMLGVEDLEIAGAIHCTKNMARVENNSHMSYSLSDCLARIGDKKDDKVMEWLKANKAWDIVEIPGKTLKKKNLRFFDVPHDIIVPYGLQDAIGCFTLAETQTQSIREQARSYKVGTPNLDNIMESEKRLAKTIYRMEKTGVMIDRKYCKEALAYEQERQFVSATQFKALSGQEYKSSPKVFAELFISEQPLWQYTEKGNPSFESEVLRTFKSPLAKLILENRDAKSKADFYGGFLYHADSNDCIHPNFNPDGTGTGRFSSNEPNLQNLTSEAASYCPKCEEDIEEYVEVCPTCLGVTKHPKFMVRRAIIPRPGYIFIMPDFNQMEYCMMLDLAKHLMIGFFKKRELPWTEEYFEVANKVAKGFDVHQATAELMGVSRKYAKTLNFMLLYGGGAAKLAKALSIPQDEAEKLKRKYFAAMPYVEHFISIVRQTIKERGWVRNWAGRKYTFPDRNYSYIGPNYLIQGGCADVVKGAMNAIDELLHGSRNRLLLTIHDELVCEIHESEMFSVPSTIHERMERAYPHHYIPLTVNMEWSHTSLAGKKKGFPK